MKTKILLFLMLQSINLFPQMGMNQEINWNHSIILKNKVKKVSNYLVLPKTNPDYYKKPIGLMLMTTSWFNNVGQEIKCVCYNCGGSAHTGSRNLTYDFFYNKDKLLKKSQEDFETTHTEYLYFENQKRNLEFITNNKNERTELELVTIDNNKEIKRIKIDFASTSEVNDNIYFYEIKKWYYKKSKYITTKRKSLKISMKDLDVIKTSKKLNEIEKVLNSIEKKGKIGINEREDSVLYLYDDNGYLVKETSWTAFDRKRKDTVIFKYGGNGLLLDITVNFGVFHGKFVYKYEYNK